MTLPLVSALVWIVAPLLLGAGSGLFGLPRALSGPTFVAGLAVLATILPDAETVAGALATFGTAFVDRYVNPLSQQYLLISFLIIFALGGLCLMLHPILSAPIRRLCATGYALVYLGLGFGLLPFLWMPQIMHGPDIMAAMQAARSVSIASTLLTIAGQIALLMVLPGEAVLRLRRRARQSPSARSGRPL
jgi:hypothetical protein